MFMNNRLLFNTLLAIFFCFSSYAQPILDQQSEIIVEDNGFPMWNPMAGGLNNPQYSAADLNNDNIDDLVIFDREGDMILTFINGGTPGLVDYTFSPEYAKNFPEVEDWAMLRDFNCDGVMDLFMYSNVPGVGGITVFKGYFDSNNSLAFTLEEDYLKYPSFSGFPINLFVSREDYPAVDDIDGDNDLDILTFSLQGGYVEYYLNKSAEMGYGCDSLIFELADDCWGRFYESGITNSLALSPRQDSCPGRTNFWGQKGGVHIGSTLLTLDLDNDNDKELILGDVSFSDLLMAVNGGSADTAYMINQDSSFPSYDESALINIFPASFYMDVNNDGKKDLLASPNAKNVSENVFVTWYYKNVTNNQFPTFELQQKDLIGRGMIDLGTSSNPVFFDHNGDGLMDFIVGSYGRYIAGGTYLSSLFLYENIGTPSIPRYNLVDEDYAQLSTIQENAFNLDFGDLDGDGDEDMIVGKEDGKFLYLENTDTGNGLAVFATIVPSYQGLKTGQISTPEIVDLNKDGLLDLVVGQRNGLITFIQNVGTATAPNFVEVNDSLGLMDPRVSGFPVGYGAPRVREEGGDYFVYLGSEAGAIKKFKVNQDSLYAGAFDLVDGDYGQLKQGERIRIDIHDINNDGTQDFIVGNRRGGVAMYSEDDILGTVDIEDVLIAGEARFDIQPNPVEETLTVQLHNDLKKSAKISIINALGQQIYHVQANQSINNIDVAPLAAGVYFVQVIEAGQSLGTLKFVKK